MATHPGKWTGTSFDLLRDFKEELIAEVFALSDVMKLDPGDIMIEPGRPNSNVYLLLDGKLEVVIEKDGSEISIAISPGECLGEMSLIMNQPTSALARAQEESEVLVIPGDVFWQKMAVTRTGVRNLFGVMAKRLRRTNHALIHEIEEQLKYKHLEEEIKTAGKIQSNMVPDGSLLFSNRTEVDAFGFMSQARVVGGDFYDAVPLDQEHLYFCIGDVSGKGMPASLLMARALTTLRLTVSTRPGFEGIFQSVNKRLAHNNDDMMFVSAFGGVLNTRTGLLRIANAGHNPPFMSHNGSEFKPMDMPDGSLLGIMEDSVYELAEIQLQPGDSLLMYTDGVTEATASDGSMFGEERALECLNRQAYPDMRALVNALVADTESFVGDAPQYDDMTVLGLRYLGD